MNVVNTKRRPLNFKVLHRGKVNTHFKISTLPLVQYKVDFIKPIQFKNIDYHCNKSNVHVRNYMNIE